MITPIEVLGQPAMRLQAPDGALVEVLLHGAHVTRWRSADRQERLYLSPLAVAAPGRSVRGGVPVIFPQFNQRGPYPRHGIVRDRAWRWAEGAERGGAAIGVLELASDAATRALWPHDFRAELTVVVEAGTLDLELMIENTGAAPFTFHAALHTYLLLEDLTRCRLAGLGGVTYEDALHGGWHRQEFDTIGFVGAIDRVYDGVPGPMTLQDSRHRLGIDHDGFPDAVVWNPGAEGAAALADLPDDDWRHMLCVEAAAVNEAVTLAPGAEWSARQSLLA